MGKLLSLCFTSRPLMTFLRFGSAIESFSSRLSIRGEASPVPRSRRHAASFFAVAGPNVLGLRAEVKPFVVSPGGQRLSNYHPGTRIALPVGKSKHQGVRTPGEKPLLSGVVSTSLRMDINDRATMKSQSNRSSNSKSRAWRGTISTTVKAY
jgi:hypothetical protein